MGGGKMTLKIRERRDNVVTQATIVGLSLREKPHNIHSFDVGVDFVPVHFRSVDTKVALG